MVTDFMSNGDVHDYLRESSHTSTPEQLLGFAQNVAEGMIYLHELGIIQRDLKTRNLLLDTHLQVKIADFGLSRFLDEDTVQRTQPTHCGTPFWAAPEMLTDGAYDSKVDVYSYGVVLWEFLCRKDPYENMSPPKVMMEVVHNGLRPEIPKHADEDFRALMEACWSQDPAKRPTFKEVFTRLNLLIVEQERKKVSAEKVGRNSLILMDGLNAKEKTGCIALFRAMDADQDGFISQLDIQAFLHTNNSDVRDMRKASRILTAIDRNGDGTCDRGEWLHFCLNLKWIGHLDAFLDDLRSKQGTSGEHAAMNRAVSDRGSIRASFRTSKSSDGGARRATISSVLTSHEGT